MKSRLAVLAAAGLTALGLSAPAALASTPASAAVPAALSAPAAEPPIRLSAPPVSMAPGGWQHLGVFYDNPGTEFQGAFTITADFAGIAGFAKAEFVEPEHEDCTVTGTKVTCPSGYLGFDGLRAGAHDRLATIAVRALPGAKLGDRGTVTVSADVPGRTVNAVTAKVGVGGPDLVMKMAKHNERPKAGAKLPLPFVLSNEGTEPVTDVLFTAEASYGLQLGGDHRNCSYRPGAIVGADGPLLGMWSTFQCRIKGTFAPGKSYRLAIPAGIRVAEYASSSETFFIRVDEDNAANRKAWRKGLKVRTGTGPELTFMTVPTAASTGLGDTGRDVNRYNSHYYGTVSVAGGADFATVGTTVRGKAGAKVQATVKLRNKGAAYFLSAREVQGVLKLPQGVSVVKADPACAARKRADGTVSYYLCTVTPPGGRGFVKPGDEFAYTFTLKLEKTLENVSGTFSTRFNLDASTDPNPANNTAKLRVNPRSA
ncbi:hypothetical protein [Streptomyces sp. NBC_00239]|uniref:hypothetical protein n=1 Tax=Streptomyces sp. NBC_00239 TaxID=2903640 RepID=UPI002E2B4141|nr:hypothetical protein [Streptomyces sp. NBC_00239]